MGEFGESDGIDQREKRSMRGRANLAGDEVWKLNFGERK